MKSEMTIPRSITRKVAIVTHRGQNADASKSPRLPKGMKMYAELTGKSNRENQGIKSLWDNNTDEMGPRSAPERRVARKGQQRLIVCP